MQDALPMIPHATVEHAHASFASNLRSRATQEFDVIVKEHDVFNRLNRLDDLLQQQQQQQQREDTKTHAASAKTPPTQAPEPAAILRTLAMPSKRDEIARLKQQLTQVRADNDALAQRVRPLRQQRRALLESLSYTQASLAAAAASASSGITKEDVWLIIQTIEMDSMPQPAKRQLPAASAPGAAAAVIPAARTGSTSDRGSTAQIETGSSPVKRKRTSSFA